MNEQQRLIWNYIRVHQDDSHTEIANHFGVDANTMRSAIFDWACGSEERFAETLNTVAKGMKDEST